MIDECLNCSLFTCDDKSPECAFVQIKKLRRGPGRPRNSERIEKPPPDLRLRTDGRYLRFHPLRLPNRQPVLIDEPVEVSGEYRAWVKKVLQG